MGRCPGAVTAAKGVIYYGGIYSIGLLRLKLLAPNFSFFFYPSARCNYGAIFFSLGENILKKQGNGSTDSSDDT